MDNINVIELNNGYYRLIPNEGYLLKNIYLTVNKYSEVVTKYPKHYFAEKIN